MTAKRSASESHAARVARGRVPVAIQLSPEAHERLGLMAAVSLQTRSAFIEALLADQWERHAAK